MIRVSPRQSRPLRLITALWIISAMISQPPSILASPPNHCPVNHLCHDQSQPPSIPASPPNHRPVNHLCHDQSQPPSIPASPPNHRPVNHLCHDQSQPPSILASPPNHRPVNHLCHDQSQPPSILASPPNHCPVNHLCHDQSQPPSILASPPNHCPVNHLCHDQSQPPSIPASPPNHCPVNHLCHDQSQPPSIPASPPNHRPVNHLCHDQSQPPSIPAMPLDHHPTNRLCHNQSQPPSIPAMPLDHHPTNRLCHNQSQPPSIPASLLDHRPTNRFCHDQSQPPLIPASPLDHHRTNCLCYDRSQLLSIQPLQLDLSLSSHLQELGIGFHLSGKRSCRGRKRKQHKISVVSGVRAASTTSNDVCRSPGTRSVDSRHLAPVTDVATDVPHRSRTSYSLRGVSFANLIPVTVQASTATSSPPTQSKIMKVLYFKSVLSPESQWQSQNDSRWRHWHSANDRDMVMCTGWRSLYCWNNASRLCAAIIPSNKFEGWRYCLHCSGHFLWEYIFQTPVLSVLRGHRASYLWQELVHIGCVPVQTPSQQEEQTLQSVVSPAVSQVSHTVCRFPQWSSTAWWF